jgi:ribosomal-protein-alanine N-acetyltransferase
MPGRNTAPRGFSRAIERGRRTFLRHPLRGDRGEYLARLRDSADFHRPWSPTPLPDLVPFGPDDFDRILETARCDLSDRTLLCRRTDGAIVGYFNLSCIVRGAFDCGFLGYAAFEPHAGKGFMREGIRLWQRHVFGRLAMHRVEANIMPHNAPSLALVRGAGFRKEGFSPRYLKIAGEWRDHERWAMTLEDWQALTGNAP